ncbi:FkbM family methyltransferase [Pseudodesulfovibrio karagichevae]|uniref:FkbM family methyltransferase n=1 Tax=Pseudodesulfovibrio karagichevae TaxID=3239305 RepID=A0ABV4JZ30_9BACT
MHQELKRAARAEVERLFGEDAPRPVQFGDIGELDFPFFSMGSIDSRNLFDLDELIIFSFYRKNRGRYKNVLDVGANIGLHSTLLSLMGYTVRCFEPDPVHFELLQRNLKANGCSNVEPHAAAMSDSDGETEFCRVKGNTTGSHIKGAKANPYGELDYFPVKIEAANPHLKWADLVKMDVEGHEPTILTATDRDIWEGTDAFVEIENAENGAIVFEHMSKLGVNLFAEKLNWQRVRSAEDMPAGYKEGSLFVSVKDAMPW